MDNELINENNKVPSKISQILIRLMNKCGIDDITLSKRTFVPASTISRIKNSPNPNPRLSTLEPLANFFDVSIDQLTGIKPLDMPNKQEEQALESSKHLPVVSKTILDSISLTELTMALNEAKSWVATDQNLNPGSFAVALSTSSFEPLFRKDSLLIVEKVHAIYADDYIIIKHNKSQAFTINIVVADGDKFFAKSLFQNDIIPLNKSSQIFGVIVESRLGWPQRKSREIHAEPSIASNEPQLELTSG